MRALDTVHTVSLLSLFLAIIFGFQHWLFQMASWLCFFVFLLHPIVLRRALFWFAMAGAGSVVVFLDWQAADNHKYLLVYWLWVLFFCHLVADPVHQHRAIAVNARFFLCFIFLLAVGQKLASPTYRSGEMFELFLYLDARFTAFGKLIGIDPEVPEAVKRSMAFFRSPFSEVIDQRLEIPGTDRAHLASLIMTWWDVVIQSAIGVLFLFRRNLPDRLAHSALLLFIVTTYLPAPVYGFGWILGLMGFALARDRWPGFAAGYLAAFVAILLYQIPWRDWVLA